MKKLILLTLSLLIVGTLSCTAKVKRLTDVVYDHRDGAALVMDVLIPEHQNGIAVFRMVSGGWASFSASAYTDKDFKLFTDKGFTVFLVSHGSQPRYKVAEIINQIQRAIKYARYNSSKFGIKPNKFCITGASSGGHLSISAGAFGQDAVSEQEYRKAHNIDEKEQVDPIDLVSSRVQAIACFFPPVDLIDYSAEGVTFAETPIDSVFVPAFFDAKKTPREEQLRILGESSPYQHITSKMPPVLVFHGTTDLLVPFEQAPKLMKKLDAVGVPHKLIVVEGYGHGWPYRKADDVEMAKWFMTYTK